MKGKEVGSGEKRTAVLLKGGFWNVTLRQKHFKNLMNDEKWWHTIWQMFSDQENVKNPDFLSDFFIMQGSFIILVCKPYIGLGVYVSCSKYEF